MNSKPIKLKESAIELSILYSLSTRYAHLGFFWKNPSTGYFDVSKKRFRKHSNPFCINGVCDILGIVKGHFVGFEVKSEKGKTSPDQESFLAKARYHGATVAVVRSFQDAESVLIALLKEIDAEEKKQET